MAVAHGFYQGGRVFAGTWHPRPFGQKQAGNVGIIRSGTASCHDTQRRVAVVVFHIGVRSPIQQDAHGSHVCKMTGRMQRGIVFSAFVQAVKRDIPVGFV